MVNAKFCPEILTLLYWGTVVLFLASLAMKEGEPNNDFTSCYQCTSEHCDFVVSALHQTCAVLKMVLLMGCTRQLMKVLPVSATNFPPHYYPYLSEFLPL